MKAATINIEKDAWRKKREEEWKIREAQRQEELRLKRINKQRFENLIEESKRYASYKQVLAYVNAVTCEGKID